MRFSQYPAYINSAIEWLGMIPAHWKIIPLRHIATFNMGQSPDSDYVNQDGEGLPFIQGNAEFGDLYPVEKNYCTQPKKICRKNDLLISVRAPVGEINLANKEFVIGRGLASVTPNVQIEKEFLWYAMQIHRKQLSVMETGTTFKAVSGHDLKNIFFALPNLHEQQAITNFLDRETARIDKLIAEKQTFIKLLKEKRQALISHAFRSDNKVSKAKLGFFIDLLPGYAFKSEFFSENNSDIRLLRGANVGVGSLKWDDVVYWPSDNDTDVEAFALMEGDIVFGMDRPWISAGARVAIVKSGDLPCYLVQRVAKIKAKNGFNQKYIYYAFAENLGNGALAK